MENKITRAKAFKVAVVIEGGRDTDRPGSFKGFLLLTRDNKARLNVSGADFGEARHWQMVSDGKQMKLRPFDFGVPEVSKEEATVPTPKDLHDHLARSVSRLGVYPHLPRMPIMLGSGDLRKLPARDFKAGPAQKVGGRDARVVRYKLGPAEQKDQATVAVWIDTTTLLPLKRVINFGPAWGGAITETYLAFTLDPRTDAGDFKLTFPTGEAEKLFRAAQEKIKAANVVRATVRLEARAGGKRVEQGRASLLFTKQNQARFKIEIAAAGKKDAAEMISDGKRVKYAKSPETIVKAEADPAPAKLSGRLTKMLSSLGVLTTYDDVSGAAPVFEVYHLVSFEAGAPEKVGGRDAKVVAYTVVGLPGTDWDVTLWIDAETGLPLQRVLVPIGGRPGQIIETYEITLNPRVAAREFRLPK
jgi:outer membrane lipoprotein-sorting protein